MKKGAKEKMKIYELNKMSEEEKKKIIGRNKMAIEGIKEKVRPIIEDIRKYGDKAVLKYAEMFDKVKLSVLRVSDDEIKEAYGKAGKEIVEAIKKQISYSKKFQEAQLKEKKWQMEISPGVSAGQIIKPIESVGLYVPGGTATYPTVMQILAIAAKVAGVKRIVACTPNPSPSVLVAADLAGVDEVYRIGGIQAIAAMAYGTETIKPVKKIAGPGNIYVTAAKILVSGEVAIDMPAGPSEILIIADETANPRFLALDMLAQAEHDKNASCVLVTDSARLADETDKEIEKQKDELPRKEIIEESLKRNGAIILTECLDNAIEFSNLYAPEHLLIATKNDEGILKMIESAGSVYLGDYSPVAAGDYASGVNHVLPTAGFAKMYSAVGIDTFIKKIEFERITKAALQRLNNEIVQKIAKLEGLDAHAKSVEIRLEEEK